jgi:hypothetical protein
MTNAEGTMTALNIVGREDVSYACRLSALTMVLTITQEKISRKEAIRHLMFTTKQSHPTATKSIDELTNIGFLKKEEDGKYECWWRV